MTRMSEMDKPRLLFTAFELSGDALASKLIAAWKSRYPKAEIYAVGGQQMADAGATLLEETTEHAAMLTDAIRLAWIHKQRLKRLSQWMRDHPLTAVIPTDSPAANWGVCKLARKYQPQASIVHLAAPQLWAWASWRIHKMRRLSDHVMSFLPFEEDWFNTRNMPATFVSHPLFENADVSPPNQDAHPLQLALLPGSRRKEIDRNWPTMLEVFKQLKQRHPSLQGHVAASSERIAQRIQETSAGELPDDLDIRVGETPQLIDDCDVALTVSGTATLHILSRRRPMVVMYNTSWLSWQLGGRWLISTRTFALPNLISESMGQGRVIDEWVPHFGAVEPITQSLDALLSQPQVRVKQMESFDCITEPLRNTVFTTAACDTLAKVIEAKNKTG